jgi:serine/threonine protein kinase
MAPASGSLLGPYEILAPLGAGGMGEVDPARDPRLNRHVAIKSLPDAVGSSPEYLTRFEREARALATLTHADIGAIYGVEEVLAGSPEGTHQHALILELVEGLAGRLARGPLAPAHRRRPRRKFGTSRSRETRSSPGSPGRLPGHRDVATTMIYTHVLNRGGSCVRSPLDGLV